MSADVDTVIRDFHAGISERDPYDDLAVLVAAIERVEALADRLARSGVGYDAAVAAVIRDALSTPATVEPTR